MSRPAAPAWTAALVWLGVRLLILGSSLLLGGLVGRCMESGRRGTGAALLVLFFAALVFGPRALRRRWGRR